jgi:hypothetical protein
MRIKCARCGDVHDNKVTPFEEDVVKDGGQYVRNDSFVDMYAREACAIFCCKSCGATNYVVMEWSAYQSAAEELANAEDAMTDHSYCTKCGQDWIVHNDDGSCVVDSECPYCGSEEPRLFE